MIASLFALYAICIRVSYVNTVRRNHDQRAPPVADLINEHTGREADPHDVRAAAPGHPHTLARPLKAVEEELVHGPVPAPRSELSRAPTRARADRSPVARLVAELHAQLRAP